MAGSNDFTGQNIQDTYQRVLQLSSSGQLADGTGSLVPLLDVTASFAVSASHEIIKEVTSSYAETASAAENDFNISNNLNFDGNLADITANGTSMITLQPAVPQIIIPTNIRLNDTKELRFGTNIDYKLKHNASQTLGVSEGATTRYTFGVGGHLTGSGGVNVELLNGQFISTGTTYGGANLVHVTSSIVSASEHIQTNTLKGGGDDVSLNVLGSITASGDISASGTVVGSNLSGINTGDQDLSNLALKTAVSGAFTAPSESFSTRVTVNDAKVSYTDAAVTSVINTAGVLSSSAQLPGGIISSSQHVFTAITSSGDISASGNIIIEGHITASSAEAGSVPGGFTVRPNLHFYCVNTAADTSTNNNDTAEDIRPGSASQDGTIVSWGEVTSSHASTVFDLSSNELTIKRAGLYKFTHGVTLEIRNGSNRLESQVGLLQKPNGGSYSFVNGSETRAYHRFTTRDIAGASSGPATGATHNFTGLVQVQANDTFKILFAGYNKSTTQRLRTIPPGTTWYIEAVT